MVEDVGAAPCEARLALDQAGKPYRQTVAARKVE